MSLPQIIPGALILFPELPSLILLAVSAFFVEKFYLSRLTMVANAFLLWQVFVPKWTFLEYYLQIYVYFSILFAGLALVSYIRKNSLSEIFYKISYPLYSSKTVLGLCTGVSAGLFLGLSTGNQVIFGLIVAGATWFIAVMYLGHKPPLFS